MFPIRDHNPSGRTPYVTYGLILANVAIFFLYSGMLPSEAALNRFFMTWAIVPAEVSQGRGWITLVTSMFLHGGLMHLGGNMLFLWIFGDNLEDEMGHMRYLGFYLASGVGAGLIHVLAAPGSAIPTVGASGAIAGVMGGYLLLFPRARVDILVILVIFFKIFPVPAWLMLGLWFVFQFFGGIGADPDAGGVAYWAHAGGFVIGFVLCLPLLWRLGGVAFWMRTHGSPPHPQATYRVSKTRIPKVPRRR
ncbi:MAG: rhomboid family intramembrane serine protease [Rhodobacteraceae bacterium]|nr:rhomboid family intramembrane serine protease [Paracoccaceae bacterium]